MTSMELGGVTARPADGLLVSRALDFLAAGPADARTLVASVCQLPGVPTPVAEQMVAALLGSHHLVARTADGRWGLAPSRPGCADEPLAAMQWVVVDVETTGARADGGDRVTEIAAVVMRGSEIVEVFETLVNPDRSIPPWITKITNINWAMVKDAPRFVEIAPRLLQVLDGRIFVAHNAAFDWRFVSAEVARTTGQMLTGRQLCTVRLARKLLPQLRSRSLDYVAAHYGVDNGARHRAAGDAVATARCLGGLLRDAEDRWGCRSWAELQAAMSATASSTRARRPRRPSALPASVTKDTTA